MARWYFNELTPRDKTREAMQGEFFATEAIRNPAEALVRESIQNSLDAGLKNTAGQPMEAVRVRIHLAIGAHAANAEDCAEFLEGAWPHFLADGNGLKNRPAETESCPFLVVEDFGTSGLVGDVTQWADEPGLKNAFYYFFRAEGRTGKGEDDRGRWGVGKYVFPRSSRANSFFGFTVRRDDQKQLLMGQAVLRTHKCRGKHWKPDGGYGNQDNEGLLLPTEEAASIDRFRSIFAVKRQSEPGLSIVIPWVDPEITRDTLLEAVIRGYFYPILEGKLVVSVSEGGNEIIVDADNLVDAAKTMDSAFADELIPLIQLGEWASDRKPVDRLIINTAPDRPVWNSEILPAEAVPALQSALDRGDRIAIRVPLKIRAHRRTDQFSHFDIFLVRDGTQEDRTVFVREGIIISDVRARRARGIRSIVVVDDKPLATLFGDSENPAHTEWQSKSSNFQGKYIYGKSYLDFVTHCVSSIDNLLGVHQREEDKTLLKDYFSLPVPPTPDSTMTRQKRRKKANGSETPPADPLPEPRRKRYRLEKVAGGFRLSTGEPEAELPKLIEILAAYDVRRGSALNKYDPSDFDLADSAFHFKPTPRGVEILERSENRMLVKVLEKDFQLSVSGFDTGRDLVVNVNVKEVDDATEV